MAQMTKAPTIILRSWDFVFWSVFNNDTICFFVFLGSLPPQLFFVGLYLHEGMEANQKPVLILF